MRLLPSRSTRTGTLFPDTTLFLSKSFTDAYATSHPLGSVIVHGTGDLTTPYNGFPLGLSLPIPAIHQNFNTLDGCNGADATLKVPMSDDRIPVKIDYTDSGGCSSGHCNFIEIGRAQV